MAKIIKDVEGDQARLYAILSKRTGHTVRKIRAECAKNKLMKAEEALAFKLVDEII